MPRKVSFHGNTLILNDETPTVKVGDRVRYTVHDWLEGEHTLSGEVVSLTSLKPGAVRVKIGRNGETDIVHDVLLAALTVVAPVIPFKGDRG